MAEGLAHPVAWLAPDRPVEGTVNVRPPDPTEVDGARHTTNETETS